MPLLGEFSSSNGNGVPTPPWIRILLLDLGMRDCGQIYVVQIASYYMFRRLDIHEMASQCLQVAILIGFVNKTLKLPVDFIRS